MIRCIALLATCLALPAYADVQISQPVWLVKLNCEHYSQCYAITNGSYSISKNTARRFYNQQEAEYFLANLTESLKEKSPQLAQEQEFICVASSSNKGKPCH